MQSTTDTVNEQQGLGQLSKQTTELQLQKRNATACSSDLADMRSMPAGLFIHSKL